MKYINYFTQRLIQEKIKKFPSSLINEGLISSASYDKMVQLIKNLFSVKYDKKIKIKQSHLGILLKINDDVFNKKLYEDFLSLLNVGGYVISYFYYDDIDNSINRYPNPDEIFNFKDVININLIKKFDILDNSSLPEFLYHITEEKYLNKILDKGLIPKSKSKIENHPERIYILNHIDGVENFMEILKNMYPYKNFTTLRINTKLINHIKLYFDPTFFIDEKDYNDKSTFKAYYTYDNIPPHAIEKL